MHEFQGTFKVGRRKYICEGYAQFKKKKKTCSNSNYRNMFIKGLYISRKKKRGLVVGKRGKSHTKLKQLWMRQKEKFN